MPGASGKFSTVLGQNVPRCGPRRDLGVEVRPIGHKIGPAYISRALDLACPGNPVSSLPLADGIHVGWTILSSSQLLEGNGQGG